MPAASQRSRSPNSASSAAGLAAEVVGQPAGRRRHPPGVLDGHPHVLEHVAQVRLERFGRDPVPGRLELDVDPGFDHLAGGGGGAVARLVLGRGLAAHADDLTQRAGHVPAHPEQRVHEQADLGLVAVQPSGDRVDQVGHVVGDDVHHQAGRGDRVQLGRSRLPDLDQGPALRPEQGELGVGLRHRRQPRGRGQVLGGDPVIVRAQVTQDAVAVAQPGRVEGGIAHPGLGRLDQQGFPGLENVAVRHRVHCPLLRGLVLCWLGANDPATPL